MGTALVTGATSGLGEEFCWQLAAAHHDLVIVARTQDKLDALAARLREIAGISVEVIAADLGEPAELARVAARASVRRGHGGLAPIGLLVNNAGFGPGQSFLTGDFDRELYGLDVMVRAVMALSHEATLAMVARGRGAILNVSSVAADTGMGTYSAHKAWVRAFTEGLAVELAGTGVTATVVSPGLTRTHFHEAAHLDVSSTPDWVWSSPEQVVSAALEAVRRGQVLVTPTPLYKVASMATRLAPRWVVRSVTQRLPHVV